MSVILLFKKQEKIYLNRIFSFEGSIKQTLYLKNLMFNFKFSYSLCIY